MSEYARIILRVFTLAWIFTGMSYFYLIADFDYNPLSVSNSDYYFWDKFSTVLLILCLLKPYKKMNNLFYVLLSFCLIRALYEVPHLKHWLMLDPLQMFYIEIAHVFALVTIGIIDFIRENNKSYERNLENYFTELYKTKK